MSDKAFSRLIHVLAYKQTAGYPSCPSLCQKIAKLYMSLAGGTIPSLFTQSKQTEVGAVELDFGTAADRGGVGGARK